MSLALARIPSGDVESAWHTGTAAQLPSDPDWAGEVVFVDTRSRHSNASPTDLWKAVEDSVPERWQVEEHEPGNVLRLRARTGTRRALAGDAGHPGGQRQPLRAAHLFIRADYWAGCSGTPGGRCRRSPPGRGRGG